MGKSLKDNRQYRSCIIDTHGIAEQVVQENLETYYAVRYFNEELLNIHKQESYTTTANVTYHPYPTNHPYFVKRPVAFADCIVADPWTTEECLTRILTVLEREMDMTMIYRRIAAYYVLYSYVYDEFQEVPYLHIIADLGAGKSKIGKMLSLLCLRCIRSSGAATASPIFRGLDLFRGAIWLDEFDFTVDSDRAKEVSAILNIGYQDDIPYLRMGDTKSQKYPDVFDVFGPKIITGRSALSDAATESRCLRIHLEQTTRHRQEELQYGETPILRQPFKRIPLHFTDALKTELAEIRNHLLAWRLSHWGEHRARLDETFGKPAWSPRLTQLMQLFHTVILPEDEQLLITYADEHEEQNRVARSGEYGTWIIEALTIDNEVPRDVWNMKDIAEILNAKYAPTKPISPQTVSRICMNELQLTRKRDPKTRTQTISAFGEEQKLIALALSHGIEFSGFTKQRERTLDTAFEEVLHSTPT